MSSKVRKRDRIQRSPRVRLSDFTEAEQLAIAAVKKHFPGDVMVFGSRAKGNWADDSDFDFGVEGYRGRNRHKPIHDLLRETFGISFEFRSIEQVKKRKEAIYV